MRQVGKLARDQPAECAHLKMTAMKGVSQSATWQAMQRVRGGGYVCRLG